MAICSRFLARVGAAALVIGAALPAGAASLRPVNLPEMVERSNRIFVGRAVDEWTGRDERGLPATVTTFEVSRTLRGGPLSSVKVKQLGVTSVQPDGLATWIEGLPRYRRGAEYLLFLAPDSRIGFTSPVGAFQGAFEIRTADRGRKAALNGLNNANLLRGVGAEERSRLGLTPERFPFVSKERGPLYLDELAAMVERLTKGGGEVSR